MSPTPRTNELVTTSTDAVGEQFVSRLSQFRDVTVNRLHDLHNLFEASKEQGTKVLAVAVIGACALSLAACASGEPVSKATHSHSAEATTPTPVETTPADPDTIPENLVQYETMPLDQFNALPKTEQRQYAGWLGRDLTDFATKYASFSNDPLDVMPVASKNNTPQEIIQLATLNNRYAFSLTGDDRFKWAIAMFNDGESSQIYKNLAAVLNNTQDGLTASSMGYKKDIPVENTIIKTSTPLTTGANGEFERSISIIDKPTGTTFNDVNFYLVTIPTDTGGSFQTWME